MGGTTMNVRGPGQWSDYRLAPTDDRDLLRQRLAMFEKAGDRVTLDQTGCVVTHVLPTPDNELVYVEPTGISWDDIGGQEAAKRELRETIRRDIAEKTDGGLFESDLRAAVKLARAELANTDHTGVILENCSVSEDVEVEEIR